MRRKLKFKIRQRNRCRICGLRGEIPGVAKASW
jgi:ribosomal protein S14